MSHPWRLPMARSARGTADFAPFRSSERSGLDACDMFKAGLNETCETLEAVRIDGGTRCNVAGKDRDDRAGLEVGNHVHADSTGGLTTLFHRHQNESRDRKSTRLNSSHLGISYAV